MIFSFMVNPFSGHRNYHKIGRFLFVLRKPDTFQTLHKCNIRLVVIHHHNVYNAFFPSFKKLRDALLSFSDL